MRKTGLFKAVSLFFAASLMTAVFALYSTGFAQSTGNSAIAFDDPAAQSTPYNLNPRPVMPLNKVSKEGCALGYYKKGKQINAGTSLAVGTLSWIFLPAGGWLFPKLLVSAAKTLTIGGAAGEVSLFFKDRQPVVSDILDNWDDFFRPLRRPTVMMPTATPYYQIAESLTAAYLMSGDGSNDFQKKAIVGILLELAHDDIRDCRKNSRENLKLTEKWSLRGDISRLETKLSEGTLDSVKANAIQDYASCLKGRKVHFGSQDLTAYGVLKLAEAYKPSNKDQRVLVDSFAKVYLKTSEVLEMQPSVATVAETLIDLDQEEQFCRGDHHKRMAIFVRTVAKGIPR